MKKILLLFLAMGMLLLGAKEELVLGLQVKPDGLDAQASEDISTMTVDSFILEGLVREDKAGKILPGIAEKWNVSQDGLVWTFYLRDAKWENGDPVTADDFRFAWLRALDPKNNFACSYMLYVIKGAEKYNTKKGKITDVGIKVINSKTLEVTIEKPNIYFDRFLGFPVYTPVNEKFFNTQKAKYGKQQGKILSNGPYKVTGWDSSGITYEKNMNYWNNKEIKIKGLKTYFISDLYSAKQKFENKEIDAFNLGGSPGEYSGNKNIVSSVNPSVWYLSYNLNNKFLSNKKIREALITAIDREEMARTLKNEVKPLYGFVPEYIAGEKKKFRSENNNIYPAYNKEKAKKLFNEGLKELNMQEAPKIKLLVNTVERNNNAAEYIQKKLEEVLGYRIDIQSLSMSEHLNRINKKNYDIALAGWGADYNDPVNFLDLWTSEFNGAAYSNPEYDALIEIAKYGVTQKDRFDAMRKAEKILGRDIPAAALFSPKKYALINPEVKGLEIDHMWYEYYIYDTYIK